MRTCSYVSVRVPNLGQNDIIGLTDVFRLLGEPNRLRLVLACMDGQRSVGDLCEELDLPQTLASQHLRLLRAGRILRAERQGRHVLYAIDDGHVRAVLANMVAHLTEPHDHDDPPGSPTKDETDGNG